MRCPACHQHCRNDEQYRRHLGRSPACSKADEESRIAKSVPLLYAVLQPTEESASSTASEKSLDEQSDCHMREQGQQHESSRDKESLSPAASSFHSDMSVSSSSDSQPASRDIRSAAAANKDDGGGSTDKGRAHRKHRPTTTSQTRRFGTGGSQETSQPNNRQGQYIACPSSGTGRPSGETNSSGHKRPPQATEQPSRRTNKRERFQRKGSK